MQAAGKVIGAIVTADAARTAGTATVQVRINGVATAFLAGAVALDATNPTSDSAFVAHASGLAFASGQTVGAALVTSGWTPITADAAIWLVLSLD